MIIAVEADERDAICYVAGPVPSLCRVVVRTNGVGAGEHGEAWRKGLNVVEAVTTAEVVYYRAAIWHLFESVVGVLVVELRGPVRGFVSGALVS